MTVYYVLHVNDQRPSGGVKVIYRHVDILNANGIDAAVVHRVKGFRPDWFDNSTRIAYTPVRVSDGDVLAYPEVSARVMARTAPDVPKVSLNQNVYLSLAHAADVYPTCRNLRAVMAVSEQNLGLLRFAFPGLATRRVRVSINPDVFYPRSGPRPRRITYMPRKRKDELEQVLAILRSTGDLDGWEISPIDGVTERQVADALRSSALFLSFGQQEGLGMPPLEALACGCPVIGYSGFGGDDYFGGEDCQLVPDGDVLAFAKQVSEWLATYDERRPWEAAEARAKTYLDMFSPDEEVRSVLGFWRGVLNGIPPANGTSYTLTARDTANSLPRPGWWLRLAKAKQALIN